MVCRIVVEFIARPLKPAHSKIFNFLFSPAKVQEIIGLFTVAIFGLFLTHFDSFSENELQNEINEILTENVR